VKRKPRELFHFRVALIAIRALPIAVLIFFIPMHLLGVDSNLMSPGGPALAIGVLVNAAIVMVENNYRRLSAGTRDTRRVLDLERRRIHQCPQTGMPAPFSRLLKIRYLVPK
jgi:copper/silver efflux system protein